MDEVEPVPAPGAAPAQAPDRLPEWVGAVAAELGTDPAVADVAAVLDLARDAAAGAGRPAAPVTTFLVGYAAGMGGADRAAVDRLTTRIGELARSWPGPSETPARPAGPAPLADDDLADVLPPFAGG